MGLVNLALANSMFDKIIQLSPGDKFPELVADRQCSVLIFDPNKEIDSKWQWEISKWLVKSQCKLMMAWGPNSSSWDDSVDFAELESSGYTASDDACMTTWHDKEPFCETLEFFFNITFNKEEYVKFLLDVSCGKERHILNDAVG
jgi:hypothetical protein